MLRVKEETPMMMVLQDMDFALPVIGLVFAGIGAVVLGMPGMFEEPPPVWLGLIFLPVGLGIIFLVKWRTDAKLDKAMNRLYVLRRSILTKEDAECNISDIRSIEIKSYYTKERKMKTEILALLQDGRELMLTRTSKKGSDLSLSIESKERKLAKRIADFLGVPVEEIRPPTLHEAVSAIQKKMDRAQQEL